MSIYVCESFVSIHVLVTETQNRRHKHAQPDTGEAAFLVRLCPMPFWLAR